jgi:tetratricopeptide (TPR) repeat protein
MMKQVPPSDLVAKAIALHRAGNLGRAELVYRDVLSFNPQHVDALTLLGTLYAQRGDPQQGIKMMDEALAINPNHEEAHYNRGLALQRLGRQDEALISYENAVAIDPDHAEAHINRGNALQALGRFEEALESFDRVIALKPDHATAFYNRGHILQQMHRHHDALLNYERATVLRPDYAEAHDSRGNVLQALNRHNDALPSYEKAIALKPDYAEAYYNQGNALQALERLNDALASYGKAIALNSNHAEAYNNQGNVLHKLTRYRDALVSYDKAITINPCYSEAYTNKSLIQLLFGEYEEGWESYEWRWKMKNKDGTREFNTPLWPGSASTAGKMVLIHEEQGFGDTLQFCRYVPIVARDNRVIFECDESLLSLTRFNFPGVDVVPFSNDISDPSGRSDYHIPLMSLPRVLGTTLYNIPAAPYLKAERQYIEKWIPILNEKMGESPQSFRIGLCWAGGQRPANLDAMKTDSRRSLRFEQIKPLLDVPQCSFLSLQMGPPRQERNDDRVKDISSEIRNWSDTAAVISLLDLVISVDTSICHLSAAMGKRTFMLNRYDTCWRWLLDRDDSPWYPSLTQFRQEIAGEWEQVIERVKLAILSRSLTLQVP